MVLMSPDPSHRDGANSAQSEIAVAKPQRARRPSRFSYPLTGRWLRLRAWLNMIFVDHGFFRIVYLNFHRVGDRAFRSAQPAPHHIRRYLRRGVRTVVNLRGGRDFGSYPLTREACERHDIAYEELVLRSRAAPTLEALEKVEALLERIEYPALFHCKAGADRAGLMSALYLMLREGRSAEEAKVMLSLSYGHVRQGPTGVLDAFFDAYIAARDRAAEPLDMMTWARTDYDPEQVKRDFHAQRWGEWIVDRLLRRE